jgi:crossover junction endodeoxyribonuclease RuvC
MGVSVILGIDPGAVSAAYALLDDDGSVAQVGDVPVVDRMVDIVGFLAILDAFLPSMAIIEKVGAMPRQGVSSTFRFGIGTGLLRGAILAREIPLHEVSPAKWKRHFGLDSDAEKARALAIRLWPGCKALGRKKDHGRAEALLLACYLKETNHG